MLALLLNLGANVLDNARIDAVVNGKGLPRGGYSISGDIEHYSVYLVIIRSTTTTDQRALVLIKLIKIGSLHRQRLIYAEALRYLVMHLYKKGNYRKKAKRATRSLAADGFTYLDRKIRSNFFC